MTGATNPTESHGTSANLVNPPAGVGLKSSYVQVPHALQQIRLSTILTPESVSGSTPFADHKTSTMPGSGDLP